jgi:hypothetical protein
LAAEYGGMTFMCQDNIRHCRALSFGLKKAEAKVLYKIWEILLAKQNKIIYK